MLAVAVKPVLLFLYEIYTQHQRTGVAIQVAGDRYLPVADIDRPLSPVYLKTVFSYGGRPAPECLRKSIKTDQRNDQKQKNLFHDLHGSGFDDNSIMTIISNQQGLYA